MQHAYKIRATFLLALALAAIAALPSARASAAASRASAAPSQCQPNPYTQAGRDCIDRQLRPQAAQHSAVKKQRHRIVKKQRRPVVKKQSSTQCPVPYVGLRCR